MEIDYDSDKEIANILKHGMSLEVERLADWTLAVIQTYTRWDYREIRRTAIVPIGTAFHVIVFTDRNEQRRVISARRANQREGRLYDRYFGQSDGG